MLSKIFAIFLLVIPTYSFAWDQSPPKPVEQCAALTPWGTPSTRVGNVLICRYAYILEYDVIAKIPRWVVYTLTPEKAVGCIPRSNSFAEDDSLPEWQQSELSDYAKSGYDIGHIANAASMAFNQDAMYESFLLSNMSPQLPGLNRGIWKVLETTERTWAWTTKHTYTIYAGNIYTNGKSKTIGKNSVVVPDYLYKIIINNNTNQAQAFLFPHKEAQGTDLSVVLSSIDNIEKLSGISFPVPATVDKNKTPGAVWPADFKILTSAKKTQCTVTE